MCLQCYHLANRLELTEKGFDYCSKMVLTLFQKVRCRSMQCRETYDVFVIRRLVEMCFSYYKKEPMENNIEPNEQEGNSRSHLERHYLFRVLEDLPVVTSREFWESLILLTVQEELLILAQKPDLVQ